MKQYSLPFVLITYLLLGSISFPQTSILNPNNFTSLAASFNPGGNVTVNMSTNQMSVSGGSTYTGVVSGSILVFTFDNFTLPAGRTISFTSVTSLGNKVAFLSKTNMTIAGTINASAINNTPGPGGGEGGYGNSSVNDNGDGPGGGFGNNNGGGGGAFGGNGGGTVRQTPGATAYGDLSAQLQGGSGGGHSFYGVASGVTSYGGGGGGAVELGTLLTMTLQNTCSLLAQGADGQASNNGSYDGNGGGSGGAFLIFGRNVDFQSGALINVKGGNGGSVSAIGAGLGGGGGGGGRVSIYYSTYGSGTNNGTIIRTGGTGGTDNSAASGVAGSDGVSVVQSTGNPALPVEITSMKVLAQNNTSVTLTWTTALEVNNYGFEIERKNAENTLPEAEWEKIGFVSGYGNINSPRQYSFVDGKPLATRAQYRLKQVDNDGAFKYYGPVDVIGVSAEFTLLQNYPNPFNPATTIKFTMPFDGSVRLIVFNSLGEQVKELINGSLQAGYHESVFDAGGLSSGMYYYSFTAYSSDGKDKFSSVKKMILLR